MKEKLSIVVEIGYVCQSQIKDNFMEYLKVKIESSRKVRFRVDPEKSKMRYYNKLEDIAKDFTKEEIISSHISIIFGAVTIGTIIPQALVSELF
jgi:hypothetical protein